MVHQFRFFGLVFPMNNITFSAFCYNMVPSVWDGAVQRLGGVDGGYWTEPQDQLSERFFTGVLHFRALYWYDHGLLCLCI